MPAATYFTAILIVVVLITISGTYGKEVI